MSGTAERCDGEVVERMHNGRAVRHAPEGQRYHCLAYPCPNLTVWFYMPAWSHLCTGCMDSREAARLPTNGGGDD